MNRDRLLTIVAALALVVMCGVLWRLASPSSSTSKNGGDRQPAGQAASSALNTNEDLEADDPPSNRQTSTTEDQFDTLATGLKMPCGVAVQPGTGHLFVSTGDGILRVVPGSKAKPTVEVQGFSQDTYGRGPVFSFGPLGVAFLDSERLIVGGGGAPDGADTVGLFRVGPEPADTPRQSAEADFICEPIVAGEQSVRGEGNYFGIAVHNDVIFVSSHGDDTKGWVSRIAINDGALGTVEPFIATKQLTEIDAPTGMAITPQGELLVGQFGETHNRSRSVLGIYDLNRGTLERLIATDLRNVIALAYSPTSGELYALDFAWPVPEEGGLFRLAINGETATSERIRLLPRPVAMAFSPEGVLYVATLGQREDGSATGSIVAFSDL